MDNTGTTSTAIDRDISTSSNVKNTSTTVTAINKAFPHPVMWTVLVQTVLLSTRRFHAQQSGQYLYNQFCYQQGVSTPSTVDKTGKTSTAID